MSAGSHRDYKNGIKNHWRRTVWNEVLGRTRGREKKELILYLAGPQDLDREVAISKGVPGQNLIAIDHASGNVARVRTRRGLAISADVFDVLHTWPDDRPVCAVMLDLCCGLSRDALSSYDILERKPLRRAVVCINLMRGRDAETNWLRQQMSAHGFSGSIDGAEDITKHRAAQMLISHAWELVTLQYRVMSGDAPTEHACYLELEDKLSDDTWGLLRTAVYRQLARFMRPRFFSYRSGVLRFDSAVFESHMRHLGDIADWALPFAPSWIRDHDANLREWRESLRVPTVARKISATMAVRTMRGASARP